MEEYSSAIAGGRRVGEAELIQLLLDHGVELTRTGGHVPLLLECCGLLYTAMLSS